MAAYIMTARRKAALRKAQLASARKRRKSGIKTERARRKKIRKSGAYRGAGSLYKSYSDHGNSKGYYSRGRTGKPIGKVRRVARKANYLSAYAHPLNAGILLASKARGKRKKKR
jgi:hypothetical protein